ncbi:hypothetical protein CARUB_v10004429mg [Capsella rubella]|uniref:SANT domain-containing protein n=1 Tax=Capsella rubella TaxID=81985 RepID=R0GHJ6_9BRAS|nr:uncharacterized protein LOC17879919 [Capsella rubella]XP_023635539.1 uncharacterized protein LOC17879919 [Capsella rubella]XP_023635540.1 uncharacterized protein LOC17879919 [Capsella rubella]EOA16282.1 hypothetical protein CARUB_v10004429mg [Capsella rubella]EOA16283.1 hypothetical protein CARUB_v10004429mg [Capsella rubella]EOA16284.1 hypothetical protein CARUB_v10004429mg [Capsella rubella]
MDFDFDDQPSDHTAPAVRAGARFKPKGRPQPKKKQVSFSTTQTTLPTNVAKEKISTPSVDSVSLDGSTSIPSNVLPSEINVPDNGTINQSTIEIISEENVDVFSREVHWSRDASVLRACNHVDLGGERCDGGEEAASAFPDDPRTQDSTIFRDFVTPETGEDEGRLDMETLDIIQEEGTTSSYVQHTGKFQPKPRLLDTVVEEPGRHYSVGGTGYFSMDTNDPELMVNMESRNGFSTYGHLQEEELNVPEAPRETVPEMEARNASGGWDNYTGTGEEENGFGNTFEEERSGRERKKGKSKGARKRKNTSEEAPNKSSEKPEKKFKHSSRRQKRTLETELLETPDEEIRSLPIRDMLRLVEYKEWMAKKEAKGGVVPPTQESTMNASGSQYSSQGFDEEDDFGMESSEYQETNVVKPDSPVNYQTYMNKTSRTRWSKEDTEIFYQGLREFGSNLSFIQRLFPNRTREQMKLKFKLEERRYPLKINDALSSRPEVLIHFPKVIKKLQEEAAAAKEAEEEEEEAGAEAETNDAPENEEEPEKPEETKRASDGVDATKESDGGNIENGVRSDGGDECDDNEGDDDFWNSYKSDM